MGGRDVPSPVGKRTGNLGRDGRPGPAPPHLRGQSARSSTYSPADCERALIRYVERNGYSRPLGTEAMRLRKAMNPDAKTMAAVEAAKAAIRRARE